MTSRTEVSMGRWGTCRLRRSPLPGRAALGDAVDAGEQEIPSPACISVLATSDATPPIGVRQTSSTSVADPWLLLNCGHGQDQPENPQAVETEK